MKKSLYTADGERLALHKFQVVIRRAHRAAGAPPHRTMARAMGYSLSSVTRLFRLERPPQWDVVAAFLRALGIAEESIETTWKNRWVTLIDALDPLGEELEPGQDTALHAHYTVCGICGSLILEDQMHHDFHERYELRPRPQPSEQDTTNPNVIYKLFSA